MLKGLLAGALLLIATNAPLAKADTVAWTPSGAVTTGTGGSVNLGMVFTPNSDISVTGLGFYDLAGLTGGATVALYDSDQFLLASTFVPLTSPIVDGYFFQGIRPVTLTAGDQYTVVEFTDSTANNWGYGPTPATNANVTYNYRDYLYSGSLAFPTVTEESAGPYYGPDFSFGSRTVIPEPSTILLLCTGLLGVAGTLRRKFLA